MNSILNIIRIIPGVSSLENLAGYAFGRVWSMIGFTKSPLSDTAKTATKINPLFLCFGCPGEEIWRAPPPDRKLQFILEEEESFPPTQTYRRPERNKPQLKLESTPKGKSLEIPRSNPIAISRSREQEEEYETEVQVEELKQTLRRLLTKESLEPPEYKRAFDLITELKSENEEIDSPTTAEQINVFEARLKSFQIQKL
ncbi:MAG: hypothetical protein JSS30_07840 [Verrucomicrobia bacterium]|nr:hypothetical protein [Verrucomicrobiota bacterium]